MIIIRYPTGESVEIECDGVTVGTFNHDNDGWAGMTAAVDLTRSLAHHLGAEVIEEGTPNV